MKKLFLFLVLYININSTYTFAQFPYFFDDFENYTEGQQLACQNPIDWTTWHLAPCDSTEDPVISTNHAFGGSNSVLISLWNDPVKQLGDNTFVINFIFFQVFIPNNKTGYFSILTEFDPPSNFEWGLECYFNPGGQGQLKTGFAGSDVINFDFEYNTWFMVKLYIQTDIGNSYFYINENLIHSWDWSDGGILTNKLAAIDFFGYSNPEMYIDNFFFEYDYCLSCPPPITPSNLASQTFINPNPRVQLSWQDNSDDEYIFVVLRKNGNPSDPGNYEIIKRVSFNVTEYLDTTVKKDSTYTYGIRAYSLYGYSDTSNTVTVTIDSVTQVNIPSEPTVFSLSQNYPNPFNPTTKIKYTIPSVETRHASSLQIVTLKVYDVLGNEVATLVNEEKPAGEYEVEFNAIELPSGIYFYQLVAGNYVQTRKMVILK